MDLGLICKVSTGMNFLHSDRKTSVQEEVIPSSDSAESTVDQSTEESEFCSSTAFALEYTNTCVVYGLGGGGFRKEREAMTAH